MSMIYQLSPGSVKVFQENNSVNLGSGKQKIGLLYHTKILLGIKQISPEEANRW